MRRSRVSKSFIAPAALSLCLGTSAIAQATKPAPIFGYFDPKTQIFTPEARPAPTPDAQTPAAPATIYGRMTIKATIAIDRSIPISQTIYATAGLFVSDATYSNGAVGVAPVTRSGNMGTVTVSFAYRMTVLSASEMAQVQVLTSASSSTNPSAVLQRSIPIPANGSTTVVNVSASL